MDAPASYVNPFPPVKENKVSNQKIIQIMRLKITSYGHDTLKTYHPSKHCTVCVVLKFIIIVVYKFAFKGRAQQITSTCPLATRSLTKTAGRHVFGFVPLISIIKVSYIYSSRFLSFLFISYYIFFCY